MATIARKFTDFSGAIKDAQTSRIWDIEVTSSTDIVFDDDLKFRVSEIAGCPPAPEYTKITADVGGYNLNFIGNIKKSGQVTLTTFEDIDGRMFKFVNSVKRAYYKSTGAHSVDEVDNVSTILSSGTKFTLKVRMGDTNGEVTKTWMFHKAMMDLGAFEAAFDQEGAATKFTLNFDYEYFTESNAEEVDTW